MFNKDYELLGFIQGDGTLTDMNNCDKLGISISVGKDDYDVDKYFNFNIPSGSIAIYYRDGKITDMIKSLGFITTTLPFRSLPTTFDSWDEIDKLSFMRGLFSANGSCLKGYGRVSFKTTCFKLINEINAYLESVGLTPNITINKSKLISFSNGDYVCRESYDLNINKLKDRIWYYENIGFIQNYKMDKLRDSINNKTNKSTGVAGVRLEISGKYSANVKHIDKTYKFGTFESFDEAVSARVIGELIKSSFDKSKLYNPLTQTFQLNYINPQDNTVNFIEVSLSGEILSQTKSPTTP
jgi:hypothetical protein